MRAILSILILLSHTAKSQSYSITKIYKVVNGNQGDLQGVPGDLFAATLTFSNSSNSKIGVFIDRYQKNLPTYWYSCFCYLSCNSPSRDTISIDVDPMSTRDITVQFKTDSVNPGLATSTFKIYQYGFQSNVQILHLDASTMPSSTVGIKELREKSNMSIYPNPTKKHVTISSQNEVISSIKVFNILGKLNFEFKQIDSKTIILNTENYSEGIYFLEIQTENGIYLSKILKEY